VFPFIRGGVRKKGRKGDSYYLFQGDQFIASEKRALPRREKGELRSSPEKTVRGLNKRSGQSASLRERKRKTRFGK